MGEEEKKPEEKKEEEVKKLVEEEKKPEEAVAEEKKPAEEEKKAEGGGEEEKKADEPPPPPPPPEEIVMRVFMHCEGCAKKVKKCLRGFEGVEEVHTDCKTHNVVVKGKKAAADPLKVVERLQKKVNRKVDLLSEIPPPPVEEKKVEEVKEEVKPEEKKEEPVVITVVLRVHMHCEACAQEIRKRIMRMKGVQSADPDLKGSQVIVKGVFDPNKLVEYVYKRTGKHAFIVKIEPEKKPEPAEGEAPAAATEEEKGKEEEKKEEEKKEEEKKEEEAKAPAEEGGAPPPAPVEGGGEEKIEVIELRKNEFYHYPPKYNMEYVYPPQIFSDENPNACSVM